MKNNLVNKEVRTHFERVLFRLIEELSPSESTQFEAYMGAELAKNKRDKYLALFRGWKKGRAPVRLVPKSFKDRRALVDATRQMTHKLCDFLVRWRRLDPLAYAFSIGYHRYGQDALHSIVQQAIEEQDAYKACRALNTTRRFHYLFPAEWLPENCPKLPYIYQDQLLLANADQYYLKAQSLMSTKAIPSEQEITTRRQVFEEGKGYVLELLEQETLWPRTRAQLLEICSAWHLLVRDYESMQVFKREEWSIMLAHPQLYCEEEVFRNSKILFKIFLYNAKFDVIRDFIYEMGSLEGSSDDKAIEFQATWSFFSLIQAAAGGDLELGKMALRHPVKIPHWMLELDVQSGEVAAAVIAFYLEDYDLAATKLRGLADPKMQFFPTVLLLRALVRMEQCDYSGARQQFHKLFKAWGRYKVEHWAAFLEVLQAHVLSWCSSKSNLLNMKEAHNSLVEELNALEQLPEIGYVQGAPALFSWSWSKAVKRPLFELVQQKEVVPLFSLYLAPSLMEKPEPTPEE